MWRLKRWDKPKECKSCGKKSITISNAIGVCLECLRSDPGALEIALEGHRLERARLGLPPEPPRDPKGVLCGVCDLECKIPEGGLGYCGLVRNRDGVLHRLSGQPEYGILEYYYDPHPTNCVACWFCPASTGLGYPRWAARPNVEEGYVNLAVFYGSCNHDCAFCQNWTYRRNTLRLAPKVSVDSLVKAALDERVTCVCFFGGDPAPQVLHALAVSRRLFSEAKNRVLRICWESNGHFNPSLLKAVIDSSLKSGGIIKFDLKAWTPNVYKALTGVNIGRLYQNTRRVIEAGRERPEIPLFTASTLLVPGYVDVEEVRMIARFIASIDVNVPYSLLAFHPDYRMSDLPPTSKRHAWEAVKAAREEGLTRVHIGNAWLLSNYY